MQSKVDWFLGRFFSPARCFTVRGTYCVVVVVVVVVVSEVVVVGVVVDFF